MALSETKRCSWCKTEKSLVDFARDCSRRTGYRYWCKECENAKSKEWRKNNPGKAAATMRKCYQKNIVRYRLEDRCRQKNITVKEYLELFRLQSGKCKICGVSHLELNRPLNIDHNHETNKVRGLLCDNCNKVLGFSKENPEILKMAIEYLEKSEVKYSTF